MMDSLPMKKRIRADVLDALIAALFMQMAAGSSKDVIINRIAGNGWSKSKIAQRRRNDNEVSYLLSRLCTC